MKSVNLAVIIAAAFLSAAPAFGADGKSEVYSNESLNQPRYAENGGLPVYVSELSNINDYGIFANGGWDGSWYAGFNVCWIEKLPGPPPGQYRKAFVGAKLGRMKTRPAAGKPSWEKEAIPGQIYVSVASTPAWKSSQGYFLCSSQDIPLEPDPENALEGVGESRWFWTEVPLESLSLAEPNYVALWSPTPYFVSSASSPVLAGGWGSQELNSWLNNDVRGYPPINASSSLKTGITVFEPAIAIKLIPKGTEQEIAVTIVDIKDGRKNTANKTFIASVSGNQIEKAWLEASSDGKIWQKQGRFVYGPPYAFTLKADALPRGKAQVRCAASDIWENTGHSQPLEIEVSR
ncbi:MAG: hypothetical protein A2219_00525 [Elusimicrobia bacterium RIFOXYA2_FULL_50_26]|nr:MAG: hypothetical protein A2219_00525 [Elusimicrobia bacterium RIFOXYA2_FULL_50_26]OGS23983.1 MAG: hypothetical protein A2314_05705 [Elusimicrobia bacterium RIFOXYB2_FULL_50_12]